MNPTLLRNAVHASFCDSFRAYLESALADLEPKYFPGRTLPFATSTKTYAEILASRDTAANIERVLRPHVGVPQHPGDSFTGMKYVKGSLLQGATEDHVDRPVDRKYWDAAEIAVTASLSLGGRGASVIVFGQAYDLNKGDLLLLPGGTPHRVAPVQDVPLYRIVGFFCRDKT